MHIIENWNAKAGKTYCYACECVWDKLLRKYLKPRISVGHLEGKPPTFVPNESFARLLQLDSQDPSICSAHERKIIDTIIAKYGYGVRESASIATRATKGNAMQTARAVFSGPSLVFGDITARYHIDAILAKAFGEDDARDILSLAWYMAIEGDALSNCDAWLDHFENPRGESISSQDISRLLNSMGTDGIMTFYKEWLNGFAKNRDKVLYDLTSISWYGRGIDLAVWGYNRDKEVLPQVNFALICARSTAMPLFAWPLEGSISDTKTLANTLQFLNKLEYKPECLMMDRGFSSLENITYMLKNGHTFMQAVRINARWIRDIIDTGRNTRLHPDSMLKVGNRVYYANTTPCRVVLTKTTTAKGVSEGIIVHYSNEGRCAPYVSPERKTEVVAQYTCKIHTLFCQDLVGNQWDRFMERLNVEHKRLLANERSTVRTDLEQYFKIEKKKYARKRDVEFNMEKISQHRDKYAGHICFITNDKTVATAEDALKEYSTRDYIEKDFDEMKNDLDMRRIRVHTDERMKARLLIQFISEIYLREIRVLLRDSDECKKMTRKQISAHIKGIYKIKFKEKYKDVRPELSKPQRAILDALKIKDAR